MTRRRSIPCANGCGSLLWGGGRGSLPAGMAMCRSCRSKLATLHPRQRGKPCSECGQPCYGHRCRKCWKAANAANPSVVAQRRKESNTRYRREVAAPGLTKHQRQLLLKQWVRQQRTCIYCDLAVVQCVDHVIPLVRGGTSYIGNLAPACHACNQAKHDMTIIEWRARRGRPKIKFVEPPQIPPRSRRPALLPVLHQCPVCADLYAGKRLYCSDACMLEWNARSARDRYRIDHGLPVDHRHPTAPRVPRKI